MAEKETKKKTVKKTTAEKKVEKAPKAIAEKLEGAGEGEKPKKKSKLEELKEKAKVLEGKVKEEKDVDLKKKVREEEEEKKDTLVSIEDYLKSSIHLGTRVITPDMRKYVYKRRADGLAVFNTAFVDDMLRKGADYLAKFAPEDIILACKREAGWKAAELFSKVTGVKIFTKKYPAGILTNPNLEEFMETDLVVVSDPWLDKNALNDALNIKIPILSICDTNNYTNGINQIIIGNNKSAKSLGMILYLLAKLYVEKRKMDVKVPEVSEWIDDWENLQPPK